MAAEAEDLDGARVLAERQDALGRDDGVAQDGLGHEPVVGRRARVVEDAAHGREEVRPQVEGEVGEGFAGQGRQGAVADAQGRPAAAPGLTDAADDDAAVPGLVRSRSEERHSRSPRSGFLTRRSGETSFFPRNS